MEHAIIRGVWPVLCTPFTRDGAIDRAAMRRIVRFASAADVDGVVFPGFASEVDDLTPAERVELLGIVIDELGGTTPILAGASAPSLAEVIARVEEVQRLGIHQVMIQAPKAIGTDAAAVTAFYAAIAEACPGIEIILQNAPAPRGSDLSPAAVLAVANAVPAIRYVKEETIPSGGPISAILAGAPAHLAGVMGGGGARFVIDEFLRGACGAMPAVEFADIHARMWRALENGAESEARDLYERTLPLLMIQSHARMRLTKRVLMQRGILDNDGVRAKIPAFDTRDLAEIEALMARIADLFTVAPLARAAE
ncbi:MAG: dihydrodipicolinate synthase family protein [Beijerinckiaceae bacterium]|jgi:4-hydroxy-tetrahydrodipicolinate synthase|nr:dihydrodipicolinate synthase family protein [Beijerinckiaceae bacterium]